MMLIKDVTSYLESIAPRAYQESYDNSGLLTGNPSWEVSRILVTLDCTEPVVQEAIDTGCNLIIAHHPIIFKGLKKLTGSNYIERTIIKAIEHKIAIYAIHTNLDNVQVGVNRKICEKLGLQNPKILVPKSHTLTKLTTFVPKENTVPLLTALYDAGAGEIGNYRHCSFQVDGSGTFTAMEGANPHIGQPLIPEKVEETRIEVLINAHQTEAVIQALHTTHPYEVPAYYLTPLANTHPEVGAGMIGTLPMPMEPISFLQGLKKYMDLNVIRHTSPLSSPIEKVAVCGGSGSFLLSAAIRAGAQAFITADFKYHEFFDADHSIMIADIGHYESEVYTKDLIKELLTKKFPTFAINFSRVNTNPISYFT